MNLCDDLKDMKKDMLLGIGETLSTAILLN